jgi:signal transduction histidine kinase/ligand-binding sensor domain-containing protein/DNA-binding response OmpR family regulator
LKKLTTLTLCLIGLLGNISAQEYYFRHYHVENGLSNNSVVCSFQDKKGFLWFGTINGLNRFDGYNFKIFRHDLEDSTSIGSNFIRCLFEDEQGMLWVGTNKGVYIFNPLTEKFHIFCKSYLEEVSDIKQDRKGNIWLISNSNLFSFESKTQKINAYSLDRTPGTVSSIAISNDGVIWVSTTSSMIKQYIPELDSFKTYGTLKNPDRNREVQIQKIYPLKNGNLLIGTLTEGVKLFEIKNKIFEDIINKNQDKSDIYARDFTQLSDNEYWIGTETGIYKYNAENKTLLHLEKEYDNSYSLSDNVILTFCKDQEGGLWVGTYFGGINYYPRQFTSFEKYFPESGRASINGNAIHEICKDTYGNLWVGTEDAGLNRINLTKKTYTSYRPNGSASSLSYHNLHGLLASGDSLWIGTFMHGLDIMDIKTGKIIRHYNAGEGPREFKSNFIITIYKTISGDILVGTQRGLFKYEKTTDDFSPVPGFGMQIQSMLEDEKGTFYASSRGSGVIYYNPVTHTRGSFLFNPKDTNSLGSNYVNGIFEDRKKDLWFSTESGLCRFQKEKNIFTRYTVKNGLPDNLIFRVLEDDHHNLYISTSRGLAFFNPDSGNIRTYTKSNGILSDQFNYNSAFKDDDGTMYFGSVKGMISFKPGEFKKNMDPPPVFLTGLEVNNHERLANDADDYIKESIIYAKKISLPYDQSTISLSFAALSYVVPEMNAYAYKMEGLDKEWTLLKSNRKAYYTKMPPGTYQFKIKGSNSSGIWNPRETILDITITPPFWETIWAYIIYLIVIAGASFLLIKSYLRRLAEKNRRIFELLEMEKEREIYHSKIEFFTNIAHEIRTPLTLIKMPLDKLIKHQNSTAVIHHNLKTMEKNTNRLIDLTNQLLDFRKTEMDKFSLNFVKTDITELMKETLSSFQIAAEQKELNIKIDLPWISLQAYVDPEALRKILSNLFNNAIKYADKNVFIRLKNFSSEDKLFTIVIQNDGYTIPAELSEKIFEPFYRVKETDKQPGSGIGLSLARSLTELHKGVLELSKSENGLNVFTLILPIHQEKEFQLHIDEPVSTEVNKADSESGEFPDNTKPLILLVEDNKEICDFIATEISTDYLVRKAFNGAEALGLLKENNVQLVISDIMMPVMDGLELCKKIKTNLEFSHIPIILLTAKNTLHSKIEGLEMGADAYIEKPFDFDHLNAQISNLITNRNKIKEYFASTPVTQIKTMGYSAADNHFLEKLNSAIDENIINIDIDVEQLAKLMNMSRPTFYRKIKALANLTPHELIHITRLKKAAGLLAEGNYKVYEVAHMVGYSLQTNFTRDFHKQFGTTPSEYMLERQANKNYSK